MRRKPGVTVTVISCPKSLAAHIFGSCAEERLLTRQQRGLAPAPHLHEGVETAHNDLRFPAHHDALLFQSLQADGHPLPSRTNHVGKVAVFGLLKRGGRVYAQMIADCRRDTLLPIIKRRVKPDSVVYSDTFASYDTLSVEGYHHVRINHEEELAADGGRHINGIENFWNQAKRHLRRFNGIPKGSFHLYLKECEWRFNTGTPENQLKSLRKLLRKG